MPRRPVVIVGDLDADLAGILAEAGYQVSEVTTTSGIDETTGEAAIVVADSAALRELAEKKKLLAALVVHDLRNPLTALQGNIGLLAESIESADPQVERTLRDLEEITEHTLALVGSLLDVEELEEGILTAQPVDVDVPELLGRTSRYQRATIEFRALSIELDVPAEMRARFDPHLVGRVVENLLDNACRYAPRGGVVAITAAREGGDLVIGVANSGPAIPESERSVIFERFFRVEARRVAARSNRGLGLYFCKLAAEAHGGSIAVVDGTEALPARFEIRLPTAARP